MRFVTKKRVAAAGVAVLLVGGAAAYAFFTGGSASGSSTAPVGTDHNVDDRRRRVLGGPVYPGAGTDAATYTITNTGSGAQALTSVTAAVAASGVNITQATVPLVGCLAAWFTATAGAPTPATGVSIAPSATATGSVSLTMSDFGHQPERLQEPRHPTSQSLPA